MLNFTKRNFLSAVSLVVLFCTVSLVAGQVQNRSGEDSTIFISKTIFLPNYSYPSGNENWGVAVADMNKDGKLDVISCSQLDSKVNIHLNNGKGEFSQKSSYAAGNFNRNLIAEDLNGDGWVDIVTCDIKSNKLNILMNDGRGGLKTQVRMLTGRFPHDITYADIDQDGTKDLLVASVDENVIKYHLGLGGGQFADGKNIPTGTKPRSVAVADMNADGIPDIIVGSDNRCVNVHIGKGGGRFNPLTCLTSGGANWGLGIADFNKDGKPDIAAASYSDNKLCVHINKGNGQFERAECLQSGDYNFDLVTGDFDLDGDIDIVTASTRDNQINVHLNDGTGKMSPKAKMRSGLWNGSIATGDVDGDTDLDIITGSIKDNNINIHRNMSIEPEEEIISSCVYGTVRDKETNEPVIAIVAVVGPDGTSVGNMKTKKDGKYKICNVPFVNNLQLVAKAQGYPKYEEAFNLDKSVGKDGLEKDIYLQKIKETFIYGKVTDIETKQPLVGAEIVIKDNKGQLVGQVTTGPGGKYKYTLPFGKNYEIDASYPDYIEKSGLFSLYPNDYPQGVERNFELQKIKPKTTACLRGYVLDEESKEKLADATVKVLDKDGNIIKKVTTDAAGKYEACDIPFGSYDITANRKGYMFKLDNFDIDESHVDTGLDKDMELKKFVVGMKIALENIYYDVAKATLRPESVAELERLVQIMNENPTLVIEIGGHTDSDGSSSYNQRLSQDRSQSVVDYLLEAGIPTDRMEAKGYGEESPIAPNDTKENKQLNRRTELLVLDF